MCWHILIQFCTRNNILQKNIALRVGVIYRLKKSNPVNNNNVTIIKRRLISCSNMAGVEESLQGLSTMFAAHSLRNSEVRAWEKMCLEHLKYCACAVIIVSDMSSHCSDCTESILARKKCLLTFMTRQLECHHKTGSGMTWTKLEGGQWLYLPRYSVKPSLTSPTKTRSLHSWRPWSDKQLKDTAPYHLNALASHNPQRPKCNRRRIGKVARATCSLFPTKYWQTTDVYGWTML